MDPEVAFARFGLGLDELKAKSLVTVMNNCAALGVTAGAGIALVGLKDSLNAGRGNHGTKNYALLTALLGLGVGIAAVGGACRIIRFRIRDYLDAYASVQDAIGALTPAKKKELLNEANRLLAMADRVEGAVQEENSSRFALSA